MNEFKKLNSYYRDGQMYYGYIFESKKTRFYIQVIMHRKKEQTELTIREFQDTKVKVLLNKEGTEEDMQKLATNFMENWSIKNKLKNLFR